MESPVNIAKALPCGLVFVACAVWQIWIYRRCTNEYWNYPQNRRDSKSEKLLFRTQLLTFVLPGSASALVIALAAIGTIGYGILAGIDPERTVVGAGLFKFFLAITAISVAFFIKQCLSAVLLGATIAWTLYHLLFYGTLSFIPVFNALFQFVAPSAPDWLQGVYTTLALGYAVFSACASSLEEAVHVPWIDA